MKVLGVIPARLGSTRLARKALCEIAGQTLVERVWRQAAAARSLSRLVLATDSEEIAEIARKFGAEVQLTSPDLPSGSARAAAVARATGPWDLVVNIQGDMPFVKPELIDQAVEFMRLAPTEFDLGTIAAPIEELEVFESKSVVKVALGVGLRALYFSRAAIPHPRDGGKFLHEGREVHGFKHVGLYVYRPSAFQYFQDPQMSVLESVEKLEQLRVLERGGSIACLLVPTAMLEPGIEVDTAADLARAESYAFSCLG